MYGLFDSGKMGMVVTGPWQLSDITDHDVSYGVQVMPSFGGSHETISGPDVYMVFNHSDERRSGGRDVPRVAASSPPRTCSGTSAAATCR